MELFNGAWLFRKNSPCTLDDWSLLASFCLLLSWSGIEPYSKVRFQDFVPFVGEFWFNLKKVKLYQFLFGLDLKNIFLSLLGWNVAFFVINIKEIISWAAFISIAQCGETEKEKNSVKTKHDCSLKQSVLKCTESCWCILKALLSRNQVSRIWSTRRVKIVMAQILTTIYLYLFFETCVRM